MIKRFRFRGFTLVEMLTVIAIIAVLAGLVLSASGYVQRRGAIARAEAEIGGLSAAIGRYKADNGDVPRSSATDSVRASTSVDPKSATYQNSSTVLFQELAGFGTNSVRPTGAVSYFDFKPGQVSSRDPNLSTNYVVDPFGYSYGYSTLGSSTGTNKVEAFNPTFDLWSTAGKTNATGTGAWIKNW